MKTLNSDALAAIQSDSLIIGAAAEFQFGQTWSFWSGYGNLTVGGNPFRGVGASALLIPIKSDRGGGAEGVQIQLSALDPDIAQAIELETYHQKPVIIWRLIFAADGFTLLDSPVFMRGRCDTAPIRETIGGQSILTLMIEGPRRDMSRSGNRMRSDPDQRLLGGAQDGGFRRVSTIARKTLYWGNKA